MSHLMDAKHCAAYLNVSYSYFRRLLSSDPSALPPYVEIGKVRRWSASGVDEWIRHQIGTEEETAEIEIIKH